MRYILFLIVIMWLSGCKKDESTFEIPIPSESISFRAIAGGAVMYYKLPPSNEVSGIRVRYNDELGDELLCSGSFACDSLVLQGFNEARQGVRAYVTLCDRNNLESEPTEVFFDTKDSGPIVFFDQVKVTAGWNGFVVTYTVPEDARGMAHIFYTGKNPSTQEPDTLLVSSFPIKAGTETLVFQLKQGSPTNNIVIRTEDFRGHMVKQMVWEEVEALESVKYSDFDFEDPDDLSLEDPDWMIGYQYLFDGNTKGHLNASSFDFQIYAAGPECLDRPLFIIDLREPKIIASTRIYAMLYVVRDWPWDVYESIFRYFYSFFDMLPCHFTIYGSVDKTNWVELGSFEEDARTPLASRWCHPVQGLDYWKFYIASIEEYNAAEPCYLEISVPPREAFRYLKVVFHKLYEREDGPSDNLYNYTSFQEFEIYTAKE